MRPSQITAAVLTATIAFAMPLGALAQDRVITGNDRNLSASDVDELRSNVLLVQKVAPNPNDDVPAGQKPPAVAGSLFTLSRVNGIDITTDPGRELAKSMQLDDVKSRGLTKISTKATNDQGVVEFDGIESGLYLLEEAAPDKEHEYHLSSPKLLLLPLADVTGQGFTYDNVVVMKWDQDRGVPPWRTSTPPTTPPTATTTPGVTTERTTTNITETTTPRFTPVESTITSTMPNGSTTVITTRPSTYVTTQPNGVVTTVTQPPGEGRRGGDLAYTGASVLWAAGLGGLLILLGVLMARRGRNETTR
ncbi:hypothetical protein A0K93_09565 [Corynebacterium sp. BCW_4722]|nr:hypothetical protein A0K93_09565 [Corynebacterium sp. BCW_4722]